MATSSAIAFSNAVPGGDRAGQRRRVVLARTSARPARRPCVPARANSVAARGVRGQRGAVAGQRQPERLGEAVHRVRGEHAGARAAGRAGGALDLGRARRRRRRRLADAEIAVIRSVGACATPSTTTALPASIGPPETNTVGMLSRIAALSMPGRDLVAVGDAHQRVGGVRVDHVLDRVGDDLARRQRVEHPAVAHGDAVVDGDRVELARHPAGLAHRLGDDVARGPCRCTWPGTNWV